MCLFGDLSDEDRQVKVCWGGGVLDMTDGDIYPLVEICSPWGCVDAGKLCNERKAGSLPDQIPPQSRI